MRIVGQPRDLGVWMQTCTIHCDSPDSVHRKLVSERCKVQVHLEVKEVAIASVFEECLSFITVVKFDAMQRRAEDRIHTKSKPTWASSTPVSDTPESRRERTTDMRYTSSEQVNVCLYTATRSRSQKYAHHETERALNVLWSYRKCSAEKLASDTHLIAFSSYQCAHSKPPTICINSMFYTQWPSLIQGYTYTDRRREPKATE